MVFQPSAKIKAFERVANHGNNGSSCSQNGNDGHAGKNAGHVKIEANEASGTLSIDLTGQTGGNGGNGATGCRGSTGTHETPKAYRLCKYDKHFEGTDLKTFACDGNRGSKHCALKQLDKFYKASSKDKVSSKNYDCNHRQETYKCKPYQEKYGCHVTKQRRVYSHRTCNKRRWYCFGCCSHTYHYKWVNYQAWVPAGCTKTLYKTCERTIHDICIARYQCKVTKDKSTVRATQGEKGGNGGKGGNGSKGGNAGNITLKFRDWYDLNITLKCAGGTGGTGGSGGAGGAGGAGGKGYYYADGSTGSTGSVGYGSQNGKTGNTGSVTLITLKHNYADRQQLQTEINELEAHIAELGKTAYANIKSVDLNQYPLVDLWLENSNKSYYRHFEPMRDVDLEDPATAAKNYKAKIVHLLDDERINSNQARRLNKIRQDFIGYFSEEMLHNDLLRRLRKFKTQLQGMQKKRQRLFSDWRTQTLSCSSKRLRLKSF
ncbi:MAG: hypothetical protein DRR19_25255 [Candidatus Parabeggiatoa sp. nov. 1]|nr:MAG: hypothetical protein DRR19_25255 [Gammaproteobacteria bacterium]